MNNDLAAARKLIRETDPEVYDSFPASVPVHAVSSADESLERLFDADPRSAYMFTAMAAGMTKDIGDGPEIWLNLPSIDADATADGISPVNMLASTLVHEENHAEHFATTSEAQAFAAELAFDRELGDPKLIAQTEDISRKEQA